MILLGIILPILAFLISVNATFAYFTATSDNNQASATTAMVSLTLGANTAGTINSTAVTTETKLLPGEALSVSGTVENDGNAQIYVILQFSVSVTKAGENTPELLVDKLYSIRDSVLSEIIETGENSYSSTAFTLNVPNANKTNKYKESFNLEYKFNAAEFDNSYKNAQVNYTVTAHGIQTQNINNLTNGTKLLLEKINEN